MRAWDARAGLGQPSGCVKLGKTVTDVEQSADGRLLTVAVDARVVLLEAGGLGEVGSFALPSGGTVESATLHPSGARLVVGGSDVHVHVLDTATGDEVATLKGHHGTVWAVRYAPDGNTFLSGADDAVVRVWSTSDVERGAAKAGGGGA